MTFRQPSEAYIIDAVRTPVGKYGGALKDIRPDDLSALVLRTIATRTKIDPAVIDDVLWGCANQAGEDNRNIGRMAVLLAGFPHSVPAATINRLCGSSLEAINQAARAIWSGDSSVIIAGGVESMSRAPYAIPKNVSGQTLFGNLTAYDTALGWRFPNPRMEKLIPLESMGETAENIFERWNIGREDQDRFALRSHERAVEATIEGRFVEEIVDVEVPQRSGDPVVVAEDEGPRADTSMEKLGKLSPAFRKNGTVTAGNSSSLNDGAAGILVVGEKRMKELGLTPMARIVATGVSGVDPRIMGVAPVSATQSALVKAHLTVKNLDLVELNEAFAVQSLAVIKELGLDPEITNVNGGAIALGHPLGCSGARIMTTLVHELRRRHAKHGLATMCIGVGQGISTIIERA
ncbi:MAG: beta-ketoadipyl CoA thiolase [Ignavibacteria bacterium RIFCSPLOWO2_02_FULL_55_14]|nr:MAG: beta-ketoadipyl CoA thiolase [Ignavibacteria bacterium GWC2_56_12]OGU64011.1 MAG: beta-ketoadipyl CoA thiolase [Ignavibacteria bacterium RIFCSPHIGHO2_02_FULL_56_12]OGU74671.1 MAG: beta-ketoadipyl CoA thiolase [Ignavibacteria bacterium RIFCSPLOWO2_02_FULL_55_14]